MCTANASVLRKPDSWMRRKLCSFNLTSGRFDQLTKLLPLLFCNRSQQVLNFRNAFPNKRHNGDVGDASDPGVADELKVKRRQPLGLIRITGTRGFPFE